MGQSKPFSYDRKHLHMCSPRVPAPARRRWPRTSPAPPWRQSPPPATKMNGLGTDPTTDGKGKISRAPSHPVSVEKMTSNHKMKMTSNHKIRHIIRYHIIYICNFFRCRTSAALASVCLATLAASFSTAARSALMDACSCVWAFVSASSATCPHAHTPAHQTTHTKARGSTLASAFAM